MTVPSEQTARLFTHVDAEDARALVFARGILTSHDKDANQKPALRLMVVDLVHLILISEPFQFSGIGFRQFQVFRSAITEPSMERVADAFLWNRGAWPYADTCS